MGGSEIVEKRVEISTVVRRTTDGLGGESGGIHQVSAHCVGEVLVALLGCREYSGCVFGVSWCPFSANQDKVLDGHDVVEPISPPEKCKN